MTGKQTGDTHSVAPEKFDRSQFFFFFITQGLKLSLVTDFRFIPRGLAVMWFPAQNQVAESLFEPKQ